MELVVDDRHPGTDEMTWLGAGRLQGMEPLRPAPARRLVVVAPHPDDEILGAGGLLQQMRQRAVESVVVAVTDGEGSHPAAHRQGRSVAAERVVESQVALERLGCASVPVVRLGLPDGSVAAQTHDLIDALIALLGPDDLCVTPWRSDGHPDHNATGRATLTAARATHTPVLEYLVWAWHWATPESESVPWRHCRRLDLDRRQAARKRWAAYAFTSQIRPSDAEERQGPLLSDSVLRRFWRPFEVFIEGER